MLTVVGIGCYTFDIFVLPMRTVDVLVAWYLPHFNRHTFKMLMSLIADIVNYGLGCFLGITYVTNYSYILHLFITDSIGKLKLSVYNVRNFFLKNPKLLYS